MSGMSCNSKMYRLAVEMAQNTHLRPSAYMKSLDCSQQSMTWPLDQEIMFEMSAMNGEGKWNGFSIYRRPLRCNFRTSDIIWKYAKSLQPTVIADPYVHATHPFGSIHKAVSKPQIHTDVDLKLSVEKKRKKGINFILDPNGYNASSKLPSLHLHSHHPYHIPIPSLHTPN
jgi:hypothetical protein